MAGALAALQLDVVEQLAAPGDGLLLDQAVKMGFEMAGFALQPAPAIGIARPLPPIRTIKGCHRRLPLVTLVIIAILGRTSPIPPRMPPW